MPFRCGHRVVLAGARGFESTFGELFLIQRSSPLRGTLRLAAVSKVPK